MNTETKLILTTREAAALLNRKPQTLLVWACYGKGPVQPIRINRRLGWKKTEISALLEGGSV